MEEGPCRPGPTRRRALTAIATAHWTDRLPTLADATLALRELRMEDASPLMIALATEEVSRFISPPAATLHAFERFILWSHRERRAGNYACFAVVPNGLDAVVGLFQVRSLEPGFGTAEWGFALGSAFWGTGLFGQGARLVLDFAFDVIGTRRVEARAATANIRGNRALRKLGAVQEGVLRRSFVRHDQSLDQVLWGILDEDWRLQRLSEQATPATE